MRPFRAGLLLAMFAALAAPVAALAAKAPPGPPAIYSPGQLKQGAAEAGPVAQRAGIPCQVSGAAWVGGTKADKKAGTPERSLYEVACSGLQGFILQADKDEAHFWTNVKKSGVGGALDADKTRVAAAAAKAGKAK